jgi:DNA-binding LacI/PurR family transcriptional regulator
MADIAARLGVSRQLVSIALRGLPGASSETRERVQKVAEELGYRPHLAARSLRQTKSRHIGVAFAPVDTAEADLVEAIYPAAAEHGYQLVLSARTGTRSTQQAVDELLGYRCAAVIVIGSGLPAAELRELADRVTVPMVALGASQRSPAFDVVRSAGDIGIALAVEHLVRLGHPRVAYVHCGAMPVAGIRMRGYIRAASAADFEADVVAVPGPDYAEEAGAEAGRILLARNELPTAVVTGNDQQAVGLLQVLSRAGIAVPGRVSLTGFGDGRAARLSSVDLTTARQDPEKMGTAAIQAAIRRIDQPALPPSVSVVEPWLVVRGSTGRPPGG